MGWSCLACVISGGAGNKEGGFGLTNSFFKDTILESIVCHCTAPNRVQFDGGMRGKAYQGKERRWADRRLMLSARSKVMHACR